MSEVSAEDAAARAREIAARLMGTAPTAAAADSTTTNTTTTATTGKRKRWGVAPAATPAATTAQLLLPGMDMMAQKRQAQDEPVAKRLWITNLTKERPAWHYVTYMTPHFAGMVTKCREEHPEIVSRAATTDVNRDSSKSPVLDICFKGRGSSRQPALPGIPEVRMVCMECVFAFICFGLLCV